MVVRVRACTIGHGGSNRPLPALCLSGTPAPGQVALRSHSAALRRKLDGSVVRGGSCGLGSTLLELTLTSHAGKS